MIRLATAIAIALVLPATAHVQASGKVNSEREGFPFLELRDRRRVPGAR